MGYCMCLPWRLPPDVRQEPPNALLDLSINEFLALGGLNDCPTYWHLQAHHFDLYGTIASEVGSLNLKSIPAQFSLLLVTLSHETYTGILSQNFYYSQHLAGSEIHHVSNISCSSKVVSR